MDKVGIKITSFNEIPKCIKIIRKYCNLSITEIRDAILNSKYVMEGSYINEDDILLIIKLYNELSENKIRVEVFEHNRKTDIEFLNNLVETYYNIRECLETSEPLI